MMRYLSVCSGIEAATVAWHPLDWVPAAFSEIEKFPRAVLAHHYPAVPCHGDFTTMRGDEYGAVDLLVGGTPCQDFSIAGLRAGIAGERGNLTLEFLRLAARTQPRWIVWENVPGVLSSDGGRALGAFLGGLAELGYGFAYRVLDAQYFGLAQRRARVFVVGYLGDWRCAAAVLFERESLQGNPAPRREAGERVAPTIAGCSNGGGANGPGRDVDSVESLIANVAPPLTHNPYGDHASREGLLVMAHGQANAEVGRDQCPTLTLLHEAPILAHAFKASHFTRGKDCAPSEVVPPLKAQSGTNGKGDGAPLVAFSIMPMNSGKDYKALAVDVAQPVMAGGPVGGNQGGDYVVQPVAFTQNSRSEVRHIGGDGQITGAVAADAGAQQQNYVASSTMVRRLTPRECERLQGFPDDYTLIPWRGGRAPDGPRYKALGNSMAVPVMRWIGERIAMVEAIPTARAA